jgi:hypothetical protein
MIFTISTTFDGCNISFIGDFSPSFKGKKEKRKKEKPQNAKFL